MSKESSRFDAIHTVCQHQHRLIVLGALAETQRSLMIDDLVDAVLEHNHGMPLADASAQERTEIRHSLYHIHLPLLASEGLVDFDPEAQVVEPTALFEQVAPKLSQIIVAEPTLEAPIEL